MSDPFNLIFLANFYFFISTFLLIINHFPSGRSFLFSQRFYCSCQNFFFYDLCGWSYFVLAELCFCDNLNWLSDIFVINSFIKQCYVDISLKIVKYSYLNAPTEPLLKQENNQTKESTSSFQGNLFAVSLAFLAICLTFSLFTCIGTWHWCQHICLGFRWICPKWCSMYMLPNQNTSWFLHICVC